MLYNSANSRRATSKEQFFAVDQSHHPPSCAVYWH